MNTQLAEQETAVVPTNEQLLALHIALFEATQANMNANVDQNNSQIDELERLRDELSFTKMQVKTLTGRVDSVVSDNEILIDKREEDALEIKKFLKGNDQVIANAKTALQQEKQSKLELEQAKLTIVDLRRDNKTLKDESKGFRTIASTPQKMREKFAKEQAKTKKANGFANQHKLNLGKADTEIFKLKKANLALCHKIAVSDIIEIYAYGDYLLCLFPHQLGDIEGYKKDQVPLLCLHKGGRGSTLLLDNNGKITVPAAPAGGYKPPKSILQHGENFMNRIESQGWTMSDADIRSLNMKHLTEA